MVSRFNLLQSFSYTPYLLYKNSSNQRPILSVYGPRLLDGWSRSASILGFWIILNYADLDPQYRSARVRYVMYPYWLSYFRQSDIKEAYFRLAKLYHPDVNSDENARENFDQERIRGPRWFFLLYWFSDFDCGGFYPRFRFFPDTGLLFVIFLSRYFYLFVSSSSLALLT